MSELIQKNDNRATIHWKLLTGASALALTAYVSSAGLAKAEDTDRPLIWIELGGALENMSGQGKVFAPPFLTANANSVVLQKTTPLQAQLPPKFGLDEEGKISFQPEDSDWIFSAAIRYGRSGDFRHVHHQTYRTFVIKYDNGVPYQASNIRGIDKFSDTKAHHRERDLILDFSAGKDVGLGLFGKDSNSILNLGVRIAQFTSKSSVGMRARPDVHFKYLSLASFGYPSKALQFPYYQTYYAVGHASRSFRGVGPSLSWNGSAPFVGNQQDGELTVDWGVDAALLFGKQKARVEHQTSEHYVKPFFVFTGSRFTGYPAVPHGHRTDRSVTVPNLGGFIGASYRIQDFKLSFGYRADLFVNAMDTGIDAANKSNVLFHGPYASISIGLGD